jgi:hypothetical protein
MCKRWGQFSNRVVTDTNSQHEVRTKTGHSTCGVDNPYIVITAMTNKLWYLNSCDPNLNSPQ